MKSVEVLKDCRSLNAAAEMNCPMPRSVEKVPIRNEKRCIAVYQYITSVIHLFASRIGTFSFDFGISQLLSSPFYWV